MHLQPVISPSRAASRKWHCCSSHSTGSSWPSATWLDWTGGGHLVVAAESESCFPREATTVFRPGPGGFRSGFGSLVIFKCYPSVRMCCEMRWHRRRRLIRGQLVWCELNLRGVQFFVCHFEVNCYNTWPPSVHTPTIMTCKCVDQSAEVTAF